MELTNPLSGILIPSTGGPVKFVGASTSGGNAATNLLGNCPNAYIVDEIDTGGANYIRTNSTTYLPGAEVLWGGHTTANGGGSGFTVTVASANGITAGASAAVATQVTDVTQGLFLGFVQSKSTNTLTMSSTAAGVINGDVIAFSGPQVFSVVSSQTNGVVGATASSSPSIAGLTVGQTVVDGAVTWGMVAATQVIPCGCLAGIDGMGITNSNATSGGALRKDYAYANMVIRDSMFSGFNGIRIQNDVFAPTIENSSVTSSTGQDGTYGSFGVIAGQVTFRNLAVSGFWVGIAGNQGMQALGGHYENNSTAVLLGMDQTGANATVIAGGVSNIQFERDNIDIQITGCAGCTIANNAMTGEVATFVAAAAPGGGFTGNIHNGTMIIDGMNSTAGLAVNNSVTCTGCGTNALITSVDSQVQIHVSVNSSATTSTVALTFAGGPNNGMITTNGGGCQFCVIQANSCGMAAGDACFNFSQGVGTNNVVQGNQGDTTGSITSAPVWKMPASSFSGMTFINNNSPWNNVGQSPPILQAALPACGASSDGFSIPISDGNSTTFNAAVAPAGSSHVTAYCDGTSYKVH